MNLFVYAPLIVSGMFMTLTSWLAAGSISLLIGLFLGIASCHRLSSRFGRITIGCYTFIAKGIPAYVQILIAYFVIPAALGLQVSAFGAAVGALAFCSAGYVTEIVRSSMNTISQGQWDGSFALGFSLQATLRYII